MTSIWNVGILTISDTRTEESDTSGLFLQKCLKNSEFFQSAKKAIVKDDLQEIAQILKTWSDGSDLIHLILTTGGTGLSPKDVTPEATLSVLHKRASGIENLLLGRCRKDHPFGSLSRLTAGTRNNTLIINFPGSAHAVKSCFEALNDDEILVHALDIMNGTNEGHQSQHRQHKHRHHSKKDSSKAFKSPSVVSRPRKSEYKMYEVHEAVALVLNKVSDLYSQCHENIQKDFHGRILATDVIAQEPYPNTPVSIKDGYAVISSDTQPIRTVISSVEAGSQMKIPLKSGEVARITTGAPLPPGANAVVQVEDTLIVETTEDKKEEKSIKITSSLDEIKPGTDVRATGSDIAQGSILFSKGVTLKSAEMGVLCTAGIRNLEVYKVPKVALLSTGNELIDPSEELDLNPGFIRDSNKTYLKTLLSSLHYDIYDAGVARDNVEELFNKVKTALEEADVLITTGGVSMGEKDLLKMVLTEYFDAKIVFGRVFMKPGKPMTFAVVPNSERPKFVFALPGNPVSTAVTTEIFVLPALRKMKNEFPFPPSIKATLPEDIVLDPRPEFKRVIITLHSNGKYKLSYTGNQISSRLLSCVGANGLLRLPPKSKDVSKLSKGSKVEVLLIGPLLPDPEYNSLLNPPSIY